MSIKYVFIVMVAFIFILHACKQEAGEANKSIITVIPKGTTHIFWQSIHAGAIKASLELNIEINWIGPEKEDDRQQQIALVDNQIMKQVSGIVLAPIDDMALRRPVQTAVSKDIPVVIIDSDLKDSQDIYTSYIATDNKEGGRIGGRKLAKLLNGRGRVVVLREHEGAASTQARADGFLEAVEAYPEIEVASSDQYVGVTKALAQQASENLLLRFTDSSGVLTIQGIFCPNESTSYGMLQALRRRRLAGQVKFIGFDSSPALIIGLEKGEINGLVVQNPFKMGYLGVKTMVAHLQGKPVQKHIDTGVALVTPDNLESPEIQELIYPDIEKWLSQ
jgi:ribose transport system substrate-binding protein